MSGSEVGRWLDIVARRYGGSVQPAGENYEIRGSGADWDALGFGPRTVVAAVPKDTEAWRRRFRLVEQSAALALRAAPFRFAACLGDDADRDQWDVLRCAFVLELVSGEMTGTRFTAYHAEPSGVSGWVKGGDALWQNGARERQAGRDDEIASRLEALAREVRLAAEDFCESDTVTERCQTRQGELHRDLRHLESLYFDPAGTRGTLLGPLPEGLSRDLAIESEFRSRAHEALLRNRVLIRTRLLSIGHVRCRGKLDITTEPARVQLPFVRFAQS